jgi:hypothetical protein
MDERVTTSFIPKASLETPGLRRPKGNPAALANIIAGTLLILAILVAGGLYFFKGYTQSSIVSKQDSLARSREAFEPDTIKELFRLDSRIETGKALLGEHMAVSGLFDELERLTLGSVKYSDFNYSVVAPGQILLTMHGIAGSYNAVALQSDAFSKSTIITDPIFSDVNVDSDGFVTFNLNAAVNASRMLYIPQGQATSATTTP